LAPVLNRRTSIHGDGIGVAVTHLRQTTPSRVRSWLGLWSGTG